MLNVTFRQLEVFTAVVRHGGFGAAAQHLDIAQASVSAHVQALEEQLGTALFLRQAGRRPTLTDTGDLLLVHADRILAEAAAFRRVLGRDRGPPERVVFACQRSIAHSVLPGLVARLGEDHPGAEVVTRVGSQEEVVWQQHHGGADAACFVSDEDHRPGARVIGRERYVLVCHPGHPLAGRDSVTVAEIEACRFVAPPQDSGFGKSVGRMLDRAGIRHRQVVSRATEYAMLSRLVAAGVGIACSAERNVRDEVAGGILAVLPLAGADLSIDVRLMVASPAGSSPATMRFVQLLEACWPALGDA